MNIDISVYETFKSVSQLIAALALVSISDKLSLLCRILCDCRCEKQEGEESE